VGPSEVVSTSRAQVVCVGGRGGRWPSHVQSIWHIVALEVLRLVQDCESVDDKSAGTSSQAYAVSVVLPKIVCGGIRCSSKLLGVQ
jgi:hypothetical protein